jgi:arsenite-transporting ATPase
VVEFLDTGSADMSCLGPLAGLVRSASNTSGDGGARRSARTRLVLVAAQVRAARGRRARGLGAVGLTRQYLVVNGVLPRTKPATTGWPRR